MYTQREKLSHYNRLRAGVSRIEPDFALLKSLNPSHKLVVGTPGKSEQYANDLLYELLDITTDCDITNYRRDYAKQLHVKAQSETLKQRFFDYLAILNPAEFVDIEALIQSISTDLSLLVTPFLPVLNVLPEELELISLDSEKYQVQLTAHANSIRLNAETQKLSDSQDSAKIIDLNKAAEDLKIKEKELAEKEEELKNRESELENKESELNNLSDELDTKESELDELADELENKTEEVEKKEEQIVEKKSVSKKKNTKK